MNLNLERLKQPPAAWFLFGSERELRHGPVGRDLCGRRLVAWRAGNGTISVQGARCPHMGADLARGCIAGERLRCPFHHWEFASHGGCEHIPADSHIPDFARLPVYPVSVRQGLLYFFLGPRALYPLPFFENADPDGFAAARPIVYDMAIPWYAYPANAFDLQHFRAQHAREVINEPTVDEPEPFARRIRFKARIVGHHLADRLLRRLAGDPVDISITVHAGTLVFVTARFRRAFSWLQMAVQPQEARRTRLQVFAMQPTLRFMTGRAMQVVALAMRRWFTRAFLAREIYELDGVHIKPATLVPADQLVIDFLSWAGALPRSGASPGDTLTLSQPFTLTGDIG